MPAVLPLAAAAILCAGLPGDLLDVDAAWDAAVASRDQAAFLARVAPDAVFAGATLQVGREAIREKWARYFAAGGPTLRWKPTDSGVSASGDLGWTIGDAVFEWKEKGTGPSPGRYVTVWTLDASGNWLAVLDAPLEPSPPARGLRRAVRTITSRDGSMEASIGTWERGEGPGRGTGTFLSVRERRAGAWHTVIDSEIASPPG